MIVSGKSIQDVDDHGKHHDEINTNVHPLEQQ